MGLRTKEEIDAEMTQLAEARKFIPNLHKHSLDAQVWVLTELPTHDEIFDKYGEENNPEDFDQEQLDAVLEAERWLRQESDEAPSVNWQEFKNC